MKNFNNKISHLLDQVRQVDNMLLLHKEIESITPVMSDQEISRQFNFSLTELETVISR